MPFWCVLCVSISSDEESVNAYECVWTNSIGTVVTVVIQKQGFFYCFLVEEIPSFNSQVNSCCLRSEKGLCAESLGQFFPLVVFGRIKLFLSRKPCLTKNIKG